MKFTMTLAILLLFSQLEAQVLHVGSMDEMGKNGFQPTVSIDSLLQDKNTLYGMGPYGFMQGEITIVKGQPFVAYADENGQLIVRKDPKAKAPFFVYAYVRDWKEFEINAEIIDQKSLEMAIRELAQKQGFDTSTPFPFRIVTEMEELAIHVVAPRSSNIPGFKEGVNSVKYVFNKISGEILGFYSEKSQGIYTAKASNIHLHFISSDQSKMGHVNHIRISEKQKTKVLLPLSPMQGDKLSFNTIDTDFSKGRLTNEQNITISDLEKFHGHLCDGLVVGALAMQQAMTVLYPNQPIDRTNLRIVSKPSPCLTDVAIYLTGGRQQFNTFYVDTAMEGLYVIQRIDNLKTISVSLNKGVKPEEIDSLGNIATRRELSPCDLDHLRELEDDFTKTLFDSDPNKIFMIQEIPNFEWNPNTKNDYLKTDIVNKDLPNCK